MAGANWLKPLHGVSECHGKSVYGSSWSRTFVTCEDDRIYARFATVAGCCVNVYKMFLEGQGLQGDYSFRLKTDNESLYCCTWSYKSGYTKELLCVGGELGLIYVLSGNMLVAALRDHGQEILDVKALDNYRIISASGDRTLRLWDVSTLSCLAMFSHHRDNVVSLDIDVTEQWLVSGGQDRNVCIWPIPKGDPPRSRGSRTFVVRTIPRVKPIFATRELHAHVVDGVQFCGKWILSKSIDSCIIMWKPHCGWTEGAPMSSKVQFLKKFDYTDNNHWFAGMSLNQRDLLVTGNSKGVIFCWNILGGKQVLKTKTGKLVRSVEWDHTGNLLLLTDDDGGVCVYQNNIPPKDTSNAIVSMPLPDTSP